MEATIVYWGYFGMVSEHNQNDPQKHKKHDTVCENLGQAWPHSGQHRQSVRETGANQIRIPLTDDLRSLLSSLGIFGTPSHVHHALQSA